MNKKTSRISQIKSRVVSESWLPIGIPDKDDEEEEEKDEQSKENEPDQEDDVA